jgi:diaminopimelate decarboxylase
LECVVLVLTRLNKHGIHCRQTGQDEMMTATTTYRNGQLFVEDVSVSALAERWGTPLYVYSRTMMGNQIRALAGAMAAVKPLICYSVKANSNLAVIDTFLKEGAGLDIVSGGELFRARKAGADPARIVFAGVGKTQDEIEYALKEGILFFTVESESEAVRISDCARRLGVVGRIAFRVNPDVDPQTHKYISTGKKENKFGLDLNRAAAAYAQAARLPNIELAGLHIHIGSQLLNPQPYAEALDKISGLCRDLKVRHASFQYLDIGGGLGIDYKPEQQALEPAQFAAVVLPRLQALGLKVVLEPGRSLVGNAGFLVARVEYVKPGYDKQFVVIDAAMNDLIRPALYQAHHEILAVRETADRITGDLVGPICESGDFLAADRELPAVGPGDYVAVRSAGADGFSMSSNYNSRRRAAEVMVEGGRAELIRARETWDDLIRNETMFERRG